jgi:uncharacterized membrane protein YesL
MKRILQIIDRIGEWIILSFLWLLTSILTLGVGMGVGILALEMTLWRGTQDHQGYVVRNYLRHFRQLWKWSTLLATMLPVLTMLLNALMVQFMLSQPPGIIPLILIVGQFLISLYAVMVYFHLGPQWKQQQSFTLYTTLMNPLKYPLASLLYVLTAVILVLTPIYVSFALVFINIPLLIEIHVWIGKKVVLHEKISAL